MKVSCDAKNAISQALSSCSIDFDIVNVVPINKGAINKNFRVSAVKNQTPNGNTKLSEKQFLAKIFVNNEKLPIDRGEQFSLQQCLSSQGLAPKPIYLSDDHALYIEEWIASPTNRSNITIAHLARVLFQIHSTELSVRQLELSDDWQHYMFHITDDSNVYLSSREKEHLRQEHQDILPLLYAYQTEHQHDAVLCHHDLHLSHVSGVKNMCFDWEYAAVFSRYFDLACTIKSNDFSPEQANLLIKSYANVSSIDAVTLKNYTSNAMILVNFTNKLWWLLTKDTND